MFKSVGEDDLRSAPHETSAIEEAIANHIEPSLSPVEKSLLAQAVAADEKGLAVQPWPTDQAEAAELREWVKR